MNKIENLQFTVFADVEGDYRGLNRFYSIANNMQLTLMKIISKLAKLIINDWLTEIIKFLNLDLSSKYIIMCVIDVNIICIF